MMVDKKLLFVGIAAILFLFICGCKEQKKEIKEIKDPQQFFKDEYPKYNLLYNQKGNFTNLGNEEYVVFYEDQKKYLKKIYRAEIEIKLLFFQLIIISW